MTVRAIFIYAFLWGASAMLMAEPLVITNDGNYLSAEKIDLAGAGAIYEVCGTFTLENVPNGPESYIKIGLAPYDKTGEPLQSSDDFPLPFGENPEDGFISLDTLIFDKNLSYKFSRKIKLSGAELGKVSLVVGASLAKGAKLTVIDLKMIPYNEADFENPPNRGRFYETKVKAGNGYAANALNANIKDATSNESAKTGDSPEAAPQSANVRRIIYVNSENGSDNFAGLRKMRGQADGPKKTIKSAINSSKNGDEIVLQKSKSVYEVVDLRAKPGQTLVVRAEGSAVIRRKK